MGILGRVISIYDAKLVSFRVKIAAAGMGVLAHDPDNHKESSDRILLRALRQMALEIQTMTSCSFCLVMQQVFKLSSRDGELYILHLIADHGLLVGEITR